MIKHYDQGSSWKEGCIWTSSRGLESMMAEQMKQAVGIVAGADAESSVDDFWL